jgi:hypothetical protein
MSASSSAIPVAYKVEQGGNSESTSTSSDANVVVAILEDAIETANKEFPVEEVTPEDIAPRVGCCHLMVTQFRWPVTALVIVGGSAAAVIYTAIPALYQYFPFYACFINFLGGVPSTKQSLDSMAAAIIPRLEVMERRIQRTAQENQQKAANGYDSYTRYVRQQAGATVQAMKDRFPGNSFVAATGTSLQSYDVPDTKIQQELDTEALIGNTTVQAEAEDEEPNILRGSRYVCLPFQSKQLFTFFIEVPVFVFLFIAQMFGVWYFQAVFNGAAVYKGEDGDLKISEEKRLTPLKLSLTTFAVVALQILLAMLFANTSRVARIINVRLQGRAKDISNFKAHLASCMIMLKKKLVQFIEFVTNTKKIKEMGANAVGMLNKSLTKAIGWSGKKNPEATKP